MSALAEAAGGLLALRFVRGRDGVTRLAERAQRFPLRFTAAMYLDPGDPGMAFVYVQNPTGGVFAGDRLVTQIEAGPGARVHLTTQSATKLNRMEGGEARQEIELTIGDGALVEYMPDLLIPQAGSSLTQNVSVSLGDGAKFLGAELVAPGRLARGERFAYERLTLAFDARDATGELVSDTLHLEPTRRMPSCRGLLDDYAYLGTVFALAPGDDAKRIAARLETASAEAAGVTAAAGGLPRDSGAFARVLADSPIPLRRAIERVWNAAREELVGRPLPRRRK